MIILACDHAGFKLKEEIKAFFNSENISAIDVGCYSNDTVDYPDLAHAGVERVLENPQNGWRVVFNTQLSEILAR